MGYEESDACGENRTGCPILDPRIGHLSERIRSAIGSSSVRSVASKAGVAEGTLRNLLAGGIPRLDILLRIADATGVSAGWLASGEGMMSQGERPQSAPAHADKQLDALEDIAVKVEAMLRARRPGISPQAVARVIRLVYEFYLREGQMMEKASLDNIIELASFR